MGTSRVLLLGALGIAGAALAFLIGASAGGTLDRVMTQSSASTAALLR
ncbi:MAG TPA: hypothetical protein VGG39_34640 [Polyangiaceae bacterium]|jgi:hypothetical protein